jgi:hypothetical protein
MPAYQLTPQNFIAPAYQGDATPDGSAIQSMSATPNSPYATGVITGIVIPPFASSIDAAITLGVSCVVDAGVAANAVASGTKIPVLFTPYSYDSLLASDAVRAEAARKGYAACIPVTRGRGFSTGAIDDSGRELYDFKDCLAAVAGSVAYVEPTTLDFLAWSGGAANAMALVAKFPGFIRNALLCFGWGDYGVNPAAGRSFWGCGIAGYQALMTARIGDRATQIERYVARCVWPALRYAVRQSTTRSWAYWDAADPIGIASQDMRTTLLYDSAIPNNRWQAEQSATTSPIRWSHGFPDPTNNLGMLNNLVYQRRAEQAPGCASAGDYHVPGYLVHYGNPQSNVPWELWTAHTGTAAPRTTALGGTENSAFVRFNAATGLFYVTPIGGDCAVQIIWNGVSKVADVAGPDTLFDMAN